MGGRGGWGTGLGEDTGCDEPSVLQAPDEPLNYSSETTVTLHVNSLDLNKKFLKSKVSRNTPKPDLSCLPVSVA